MTLQKFNIRQTMFKVMGMDITIIAHVKVQMYNNIALDTKFRMIVCHKYKMGDGKDAPLPRGPLVHLYICVFVIYSIYILFLHHQE